MVKYIKMDKNFNPISEIEIPQNKLTAECWSIQFEGLKACESCNYRDTDNCGGINIRKRLMNKEIEENSRYDRLMRFKCPKHINGCTFYPLSDGTPSTCWFLEGNPCKKYDELLKEGK